MNLDLPQFDADNPSGWAEVNLAYDLASLAFQIPLAIQVFHKEGKRVLVTGVVTSTEDTFALGDDTNDHPIESMVYFQHGDILVIEWENVSAVIAMVAAITEVGVEAGQ